jgi:hypothetical protein
MALTTIPAAGAKLRASVLQSLITEVRPIAVRKSADESLTSNTTLQNDDELTVAVEANATFDFKLLIRYDATAASDLKTQLVLPSGGTAFYVAHGIAAGDSTWRLFDSTEASVHSFEGAGAGTVRNVTFLGHIVTSSTAGSATLQWAQATSGGTATIVKAGSFFVIRRTA